jgi:aryl-alcohol dehydrogenase-like predicted oxidoreductase
MGIPREALFLCSKAGYLAFDGAVPDDPKAWFEETFVKPGIADYVDVVQGVHCMAPAYLKYEIGQSLRNLGVDSIDVYYVHNPETQLSLLTRAAFYKRLREAFAAMEEEVAAGRIVRYGLATWDGFRVPPEDGRFLDLKQVLEAAKDAAGGPNHHFSMVQLPYNLAMTEAYTLPNQDDRPLLEAAAEQGIAVVTSASLMQSQVIGRVPGEMRSLAHAQTDAQMALQFARSAPGVLTSLAGMSSVAHVEENLGIRRLAPVGPASYEKFFG